MKMLSVALVCFVVVLASCDARETRVNAKEDLAGGEKLAVEFLNYRKDHNLDKAMELTQVKKDNPQYNSHLENFKKIEAAIGSIVAFKLDSARSNVVKEGFELSGEIKLSYTVNYEHGKANEDYYLGYVSDELKIMQYIVNM